MPPLKRRRFVEPARVHVLRPGEPRASGEYVLYWMQRSQRSVDNPALEHAIRLANEAKRPLVVAFGLNADDPEANRRHYRFMLEGLVVTAGRLRERGVRFVLRIGDPAAVAAELAERASAVVCDRGYLRYHRAWRARLRDQCGCPLVEVEGDAVVPLAVLSEKAEYAARTLRPKVHRHLDDYLVRSAPLALDRHADEIDLAGERLEDPRALVDELDPDPAVGEVSQFLRGGEAEAETRLDGFLRRRLDGYALTRRRPETGPASNLSPYLRFGQISPVTAALRVRDSKSGSDEDRDVFLEELTVRRTLAQNFVWHTPAYDRYDAMPRWARATLAEHSEDARPHPYEYDQLEGADTHDPYWNAAMREMRITGTMHNAMRMYWGKRILEWHADPAAAYAVTLRLNNRWFLDGRDPNSYANVGWLFGLHDRPWPERPRFGTVRSMTPGGLERKCDIRAYVSRIDALAVSP